MFLNRETVIAVAARAGYKSPNIANVDAFCKAITDKSELFGINTPERLALFVGQCVHESGGFRNFTEIGGPKKHYAPFYGRGPIQVTWKGMYEQASVKLFGDKRLLNNPNLANDPYLGTMLSMYWWEVSKCNAPADKLDIDKVSKIVNSKDVKTFQARKKYTVATIDTFKAAVVEVKYKGEATTRRHTVWDYLKVLSSWRKK
jgi:predicted chitinase